MNGKDYDEAIMKSFWNNCNPRPPHTVTKVKRILHRVAGTMINPKVSLENFSDEDAEGILNALQARNRDRIRTLVLEAMKKVKQR